MKGGIDVRPFTVSQRLKQIMSERNLKQADIIRMAEPYAEMFKTKLTKSALTQYVNGGTVDPRADKISLISYALGVSEAWLLGFDVPVERTTPIPGNPADGRNDRLVELFMKLSA